MRSALRPFLCSILLCSQAMAADDLLGVYREAMMHNAGYQAARAEMEADRLEEEKAKAQLWPSVSLSAANSKNQSDRTTPSLLGTARTENFRYDSYNYSLNIRQPLVRPKLFASLDQARALGGAAQANFDKAGQELAIKVITAYCDALFAQDQYSLVLAQRETLEAQLASARSSFTAGSGTLTDIDDAQSKLDLVNVQQIEAYDRIEDARRTLAALIGRDVQEIAPLAPARIALTTVSMDTLPGLIEKALSRNPEVEALRHQMLAAEQEVNKASAEHFPTVDLIASSGTSANDNVLTLNKAGNTRYQTNAVGIQLNVPIYSGGYVNASVAQARAREEISRRKFEEARHNLESEVRKEFNTQIQAVARIRAMEQAQESSVRLVYSTGKGIQAGTRTSIDALLATQQLSSTRRDLAESRYKYVLAKARLLALTGDLSEEAVTGLNRWFGWAEEGDDPCSRHPDRMGCGMTVADQREESGVASSATP